MPQTRFVLKKALEMGHKAIVVINKVDRKDAEPSRVLNETFDLFIELGATETQADFPIIYAQATAGRASLSPELGPDLAPLFDVILRHVPAPMVDPEAPLQLLVTMLGYDDYRGVRRSVVSLQVDQAGQRLARLKGMVDLPWIRRYLHLQGLNKIEIEEASAGDIISLAGLEGIAIGDTGGPKPDCLAHDQSGRANGPHDVWGEHCSLCW
jgi:GTP-binding protein